MIHTSYFAKMRKFTKEQLDACICIARYQPHGVNLLNYMNVAPKDQILWKYKKDKDQEAYTKAYKQQLSRLDVHQVAKDLDGKICICYEKSEDFCHRHLLAEWLRDAGYECEELTI